MRFSICLFDYEGSFAHFLYDICKYICFGIESAGHDCCILKNRLDADRINILIGSHRLTDPGLVEKIKNAGKYILFQTEIITGDSINNWPVQKAFRDVQMPLMRNATSIWTGAVSKARLQEMGIDSDIFIMGYHPAMEEIRPKRNKDIDFSFLGSITPHRRKLIDELSARGGKVVTIFDDAAMYRNDLIARTRVNLAPNQGPGMNHFGGSRVLYLVNNRSIVVVERCHDQVMFEHCFPFADTEQWADLCMETLRRPDLTQITEEYYERFKKIRMVDFIEPLLDKYFSAGIFSASVSDFVGYDCPIPTDTATHPDKPLQPYLQHAATAAVKTFDPPGQMNRQSNENPPIFSAETASIVPSLINDEFTKGLTSIIIPVHSGDLHACVSSLRKHTKEAHEVIFVDRGAAPAVKKWLTKAVKDNHHFQLLQSDREANFIHSLNAGINQSKGEYIVFLFDDVLVNEGWLPDMLGFLHSSENTGIVGPMSDTASGMQRAEGFNSTSKEERILFRERNRHRRIYVRYLEGFCLLFRRSLLSSIHLLDEAFGADKHVFDDFCVRSVLKGYRNVIAGNVFVHNGGGIHGLMSRDRTFFDDKWRGLEASSSLAEKVLTVNAMEKARSLFNKGSIDDAVKTLIGRIGFSPHENKLYYLLAEMLIEEKKFQDALGALKGTAFVEGDAEYHEALGYGHEGLALYREAEEHADKALAVNGRSAPALNLKGILAYRKGDTENAKEQFLQALEADPGYGEPYTNLGMLKWLAGDQEGALDLFEKGFILSPDRADIITAYYDAVHTLDLYGRAETIFSEARNAYPENMRILFLLTDLLLKQDKHHEAMKLVERAMVHLGMDEGILAAALEIRKKIGPKIIKEVKTTKSKAASSLSVCMIVKNEEKHLAYCLNSLTPVADEMIVVDTGSTDKTKEIAEAFGARIFDFEWINDFSAARNYSLSQAQGDWILVMDADEVISGQDYVKLKKLLNKKQEIAYNLVTRNYVHKTAGDGWVCNDNSYIYEQAGRGWFPSGKVRLFPNNEKIRFEQPIHELVEYSLQKIGMGAKESGVPVHHYGELDATKATAKDEQYYELGLKKMRESGGDFKSVWELAVQAGELGKLEESIELWHKVIGFKHREAAAYFNLANHYLNLKKFEESYECSRKAYALDPRDQSSVLSFAMSEFLAGDLNKAIAVLEGFLQGSDAQTSHAALLAVSYLLTGKTDEGLNFLRRGVKKGYNMVHYLQQLSQSLLTAGNRKRAISLLTTAIDIKYYSPQMHTLLDECRTDA